MTQTPIPTLAEFMTWSAEQIQPLVQEKTALFSPGGSSRWFFLEHGDASQGYSQRDIFLEYAELSLLRTLDVAETMFEDGIRTLFVVGIMPGQFSRDDLYSQNIAESMRLMLAPKMLERYAKNDMGVIFRGAWEQTFEVLGIPDVYAEYKALEAETAQRKHWMVWFVNDDPIPASLAPYLKTYLMEKGRLPSQAELAQAYYGRAFTQLDIFIGHNKPNLAYQLPPFLTIADVYMTVTPSYYMDKTKWRLILYDHLFARRGRMRDYTSMAPEALGELREFYAEYANTIIGVGSHHAPTQTWRPVLLGS